MSENKKLPAPVLIEDLGVQQVNINSPRRSGMGIFRCRCGVEFRTVKYYVKSGNTKSCGCSWKTSSITHGYRHHPLYQVYGNIVSRTTNPKATHFIHYGGRGIVMCDEWIGKPAVFINWAFSNGWEKGKQIDRIDNDGNYTPENCRFVTSKVNCNNRRMFKNNTSGVPNIYITKYNTFEVSINGEYIGTVKTMEEAIKLKFKRKGIT
jgi:hypothetical protein